jgi:hypothetical protein
VQVVGTLFNLMEHFEHFWKNVSVSRAIPLFGEKSQQEPEAVEINMDRLVREYRLGFSQFKPLYQAIFSEQVFAALEKVAKMKSGSFGFSIETWLKVLYELAAAYHRWKINRMRLLHLMVPLYYGRVASFVNETADMDSIQAEVVVEKQAEAFEEGKNYLLQKWDERVPEPEILARDF